MEASIVDLRYRMKDVLKALERNEEVHILYHGKLKGVIMPKTYKAGKKVADSPFFGMVSGKAISVDEVMGTVRGNRYDAL